VAQPGKSIHYLLPENKMSATAVHICLEDNNNDDNEEPMSHYFLDEMMVGNRGHVHMDFYWPEYHRGEERRLQQKYPDYKSWVNYYFVREMRNQEYLTPEYDLLRNLQQGGHGG